VRGHARDVKLGDAVPQTPWDLSLCRCSSRRSEAGRPSEGRLSGPSAVVRLQIGARCKQSGMFWGVPGAGNILALRCIHASRRLDEYWRARLDQQAARNDVLRLRAA